MDIEEFDRFPQRQKCPYGFTCSKLLASEKSEDTNKDCQYFARCTHLLEIQSNSFDPYHCYLDKIRDPIFKLADRRERRKLNKQEEGEYQEGMSFLVHVDPHQRALQALKTRGNGQHIYDFDLGTSISKIGKSLKLLNSGIQNNSYLYQDYIAPEGVEVNSYGNKHPPSYKLKSKIAQFESEKEKGKKCKVIYLGKSSNEKTIQARLGIERRNRLSKIRTRLIQAQKLLEEAAELAAWEFSFDEIVQKSEKKD